MRVPLLDLKLQWQEIQDEVMSAVKDVAASQQFILGPKVDELEKSVAEYCGCRYGIGVSSGTDALLISLMTEGVGAGDAVLTTPYSFFATAGVISRVGAVPLFVDIDPETYNIDPKSLTEAVSNLNEETRSRVKAVIPVHLFGQCAEMGAVKRTAREHGLAVIEDAAQAIGSEYEFEDGLVKRAGGIGKYGCFSFFPSKNLGAFGDGGMVTTNDETVSERLRIMRVHGSKPKYYHRMVGGNFRLDALQAAVLLVKLKYLDQWTERRRRNAELYRSLFSEKGMEEVSLPLDRAMRHIYNQFVIRVQGRRDALRDYLQGCGIGCEIYYPVPLHLQPCYEPLGYEEGRFPVSEAAAKSTLALPIFPELTEQQIEYVVEKIGEFFGKK